MYRIDIGTEVAVLNSQVQLVPSSQVVLKTDFTIALTILKRNVQFPITKSHKTPDLGTGITIWNIFFQVLGKDVYYSNLQVGGIQIMHKNGVAHAVAETDLEGVYILLKWLSYMPEVSVLCHITTDFALAARLRL